MSYFGVVGYGIIVTSKQYKTLPKGILKSQGFQKHYELYEDGEKKNIFITTKDAICVDVSSEHLYFVLDEHSTIHTGVDDLKWFAKKYFPDNKVKLITYYYRM